LHPKQTIQFPNSELGTIKPASAISQRSLLGKTIV